MVSRVYLGLEKIPQAQNRKQGGNHLKQDTLRIFLKEFVLRRIGLTKLNGNNMKVKAPKGYHWMKSGSSYTLMKNPSGGYKPHKGASESANFKVQKTHKK